VGTGKARRIGWPDVFALSFWGCVMLVLYSLIPVLTILAGVVTLKEGLGFWGLALIGLGLLALIGPFYVLSRRKEATEKPAAKADDHTSPRNQVRPDDSVLTAPPELPYTE
jgi:hypothetical protein